MAAIAHPEPFLPALRRGSASDEQTPLAVVLPLQRRPCKLPRRVYRRRRLAVLVASAVVVVVVTVAGLAVAGGGVGAEAVGGKSSTDPSAAVVVDLSSLAGRPIPAGAVYVVRPGDTLWEIARLLRPGHDPRATVDRLVRVNGSAVLAVGERIKLS